MRALLLCALLASGPALAVEDTQWPPAGDAEVRMRELQLVIGSRESTPAQRESAREELMGLLMSPGGRARGPLPEKRPARAAIDVVPNELVNVAPSAPPPGGVAHIEVTVPPKAVLIPNSGIAVAPTTNTFAIDPRTGHILHGAGTGYVDPRTGLFIPR